MRTKLRTMLVKSVIRRKNHKGKVQIYVKLYLDRNKSRYFPTKLYIEPSLFNHDHGRVKPEYVNSGEMNITLIKLEQLIELEYLAANNQTFNNGIKLNAYFLDHIKKLSVDHSFSHCENLKSIARKLEEFRPGALLTDVDYSYLKEYKHWCHDKKKNKTNTINKNYEQLRAVINEAIKDDKFDANKNPFHKIEINNVETKKKRLPYSEIKKLEDYETDNQMEQLAKLFYLFSFYNAGIRFSDQCRMKWATYRTDEIRFTPSKTKKTLAEKIIPVTPPVKRIIDHIKREYKTKVYMFPMLDGAKWKTDKEESDILSSWNVKLNTALKRLSKKAELSVGTDITMHTSRHSFTDYALQHNIPPYIIMELLGHKKFSTTQRYLGSFHKKENTEAINTMFGKK